MSTVGVMARKVRPLRSVGDAQALLADKIRDLPEQFMECRDLRHAWQVSADYHVTEWHRRKARQIARTLVCPRCGAERREVFLHTSGGLEKVGQQYVYPDGYQMTGVVQGVKPSALVQEERYRRVLEHLALERAQEA